MSDEKKLAIIATKGTLDWGYPPFILASTAAALPAPQSDAKAAAPAAKAEPSDPVAAPSTPAPDGVAASSLAPSRMAPDSPAKPSVPPAVTESPAAPTPSPEKTQLPPAPTALATTAAHPAARRTFRVLLVEGDKSAQLQAITILDKAGHWVDLTTSGQEAVKAIARRSYDAVLIDLELTDISGFDVARLARRLGGPSAQVPIIAMVEDRMRFAECLDAGMDDILLKPLRGEDVERKLTSCVGPKPAGAQAGEAQGSGSPAAAAAPDCSRRDGPSGVAMAEPPGTAALRSASGG